jgi:hypothetical protein
MLENYAQARDHFKAVVPIRGRKVECKPLGQNRRYTWFEIEKNVNHYLIEGDPLGRLDASYALTCGNKALVEFYPDGEIAIRDTGWHNPTAMGFLTHSLRAFGTIQSYGHKWYFVNKKQQAYALTHGEEGLRIRPNEEGFYQPTNPVQEYKLFANRKELNRLRKEFKEFTEYTRTMLAMDDRVSFETADALGMKDRHLLGTGYWGRYSNENRPIFIDHVRNAIANNDLTLMFSLAQCAGMAFGGYTYYTQGHSCTPQAFDRGFSEMLKYEFQEVVFRREAVPIGVPFRDANQKYVG